MIASFYKPNASNSGNAVGLRFDSKKGKLYLEFLKQKSWNAATRKGAFDAENTFTISLNGNEIGALLNTIERGIESKLYHSTDKGATSIEFKVFTKEVVDPKTKTKTLQKNGFTISVNPKSKNETETPRKYGFWFIDSEARQLRSFLEFTLDKFWSAEYAADKARREEYFKNKEAGNAPAKKASKAEEPAAEVEGDAVETSDDNPFAS